MFFKNKDSVIFYIKYVKNIKTFLSNKNISKWQKFKAVFMLIMMILYLVSPIDIVPDFIPIFGYIEDVLVTMAMMFYIGNLIYKNLNNPNDPDKTELKKDKASKLKNKKVIDVKFSDISKDKDE